MIKQLGRVTILVPDQDAALAFYTGKLGLEKRQDLPMGPGGRWLTVAPKGQKEVEIVLLKPDAHVQGEELARKLTKRIGEGTTWVFYTDDCKKTHQSLSAGGVKFVSPPQEQPYGLEAVFQDPYGNTFSLLQPRMS